MGGFMALDRKYAISKVVQHKSLGAVKRSLEHSMREKLAVEAKERIDPSRSHLNNYGPKKGTTVADRLGYLEERLKPYQTHEAGYRKLQSSTKGGKHDSVLCTEYVITMSPEIARKMTNNQKVEYFRKCTNLLRDQYGEKNLVQFAVHRDEKSEHIHVWFFPEVVEKRVYKLTSREKEKQKKDPKIVARVAEIHSLSSSTFLGSRAKMREMWDKVAEIGKEYGMIRGRRGSFYEAESHKKYQEEAKKLEKMVSEMFEPRKGENPKKILERLKPVILEVYLENLSLQGYAKEHEIEAQKSNEPTIKKAIMAFYEMTEGLNSDERKEEIDLLKIRIAERNALKAEKEKEYQKDYRNSHKKTKTDARGGA